MWDGFELRHAPGDRDAHESVAKDNKMQRWLDGPHDVAQVASQLGRKTRVISVMDREADFFELFDEQRRGRGRCAGARQA